MISLIISVFASLAIVFSAPVAATVEAPMHQVEQQQQQQQQQDSALMQDVWQTVDDYSVENTTDREMYLDYVATLSELPSELPRGQFALSSLDLPNTYHVYKWSLLYHA